MPVNSPQFLIFLSIVFILFWSSPPTWRWLVILISSFLFYSSFIPVFSLVLIISISFNYLIGLWMDKILDDHKRARVLVLGIFLNLTVLAGFKYLYLFSELLPVSIQAIILDKNSATENNPSNLINFIMPIGLSFFSLSVISYLIEIKRKRITAERHPGYFACYVAFFPKIVMGPIERPQHFIQQIHETPGFNYDRAVSGLRLMLWGYFKKLVISDRVVIAVDAVYSVPDQFPGPSILMATVFYAFQLYFDFSAYSDIARGAGRILGFDLSLNFNRPYAATSIKEFWTRWHITLSTWLRDYVFLPVAYSLSGKLTRNRYFGMKTEKIIYVISITITFFLCGIWHGAGWNYIIWGLLFAFYLALAHLLKKPGRIKNSRRVSLKPVWLVKTVRIFLTFILVCFTWIFFRTTSPEEALKVLTMLLKGWNMFTYPGKTIHDFLFIPGIPNILELVFTYGLLIFTLTAEYLWTRTGVKFFNALPGYIRWSVYAFLIFMVLTFGIFGRQFIYAQF